LAALKILKPVQPINTGDVPLDVFVKEAQARGIFVFDLETTGLS
jgi:hypothetical protein